MITVQPPSDLPPYNEVVVLKVRLDNGHIKYRTDARDRPAFRREFRTFRYDDNGFLLNKRHEAHVIAWAHIPLADDPRWKGVVLTPPAWIAPCKSKSKKQTEWAFAPLQGRPFGMGFTPRVTLPLVAQPWASGSLPRWGALVRTSSLNVHRSPFTVHRSPFTVHRSPFTVQRLPFPLPRFYCP